MLIPTDDSERRLRLHEDAQVASVVWCFFFGRAITSTRCSHYEGFSPRAMQRARRLIT